MVEHLPSRNFAEGVAEPQAVDESPFVELGVSGLERSGGLPRDEWLEQLSNDRLFKVVREMADNDSTVGAILFAIEQSMRQADWSVRPKSELADDAQAVEYAEFVESCLHDMSSSWHDTLSETLTVLPYGWALQEIVLKRRAGGDESAPAETRSNYEDNRIGWRKLPLRAQDTRYQWHFDANGGTLGMWQQAPPDYQIRYLPIKRTLLFRTTTAKNNPEGRSVLRNSWKDWHHKTLVQEIEGIGIERDLAGLPRAKVPWTMLTDQATVEEQQILREIKKILRNVRRDDQEGIIWPHRVDADGNEEFELDLMTSGGRRQFDTQAVVQRYDARIAMSVLADFILLGHTKVGTQSLSVSKIQLFQQALKSWMDMIAGVYNRFAIPRLLSVNGMDLRKAPELTSTQIESSTLPELAEYLGLLSGLGMPLFPDAALEDYIRSRAGLPARPEDAELPEADDDEVEPDDQVPPVGAVADEDDDDVEPDDQVPPVGAVADEDDDD